MRGVCTNTCVWSFGAPFLVLGVRLGTVLHPEKGMMSWTQRCTDSGDWGSPPPLATNLITPPLHPLDWFFG